MRDQLQPQGFTPTEASKSWRLRDIRILPVIGVAFVFLIGTILWFLFTANAVRFESNAPDTTVTVSGGIVVPSGPSFLIRPGSYRYHASAPEYKDRSDEFLVSGDGGQTFAIEMQPKPSIVTIESTPSGATVFVDDASLGVTPLVEKLEAGEVSLRFSLERYQSKLHTESITGKNKEQTITVTLNPDWGDVWIETSPNAARVSIDGEPTSFRTPGPIEVLSGEHVLAIDRPGYEVWRDILLINAGERIDLDPVNLKLVGATLVVDSDPQGATITVDGKYVGTTPLTTHVSADGPHEIKAILTGYHESTRRVTLQPETERSLLFDLKLRTGEVIVTTQPEDVEIWVNGELRGTSDTTLQLQDVAHQIALKKLGYADYQTSLTPRLGIPQELKVRLLTVAEARMEALKRVRSTLDGHQLVLLQPTTIRMGASRREPGRRGNEVYRTTRLTRLFYLSRHEVTNEQFRTFASAHDSGEFQSVTLNRDVQPVVNVSWKEAAQYCNWLSEREGFDPFYVVKPAAEVTLNANSLGYRLPTEAEWAWTARTTSDSDELLHFPWGDTLPPPIRHGNYADRAAQHIIGRIIFDYNDNQIVSANIGTFLQNSKGLFDMGGNVAEWVHDYYHIPSNNAIVDELGEPAGEFHVIRGSSWKHGTITDLRLSFRDYGLEGRDDVGFRLARYAE